MLHAAEGSPSPRHPEAGLEQRLIIRLSVVGDQGVELRQVAGQPMQQACFLAQIAHEKLAQTETFRRDASHADQKCVRSRAARKSRGLGIQKRPARAVRSGDSTLRHSVEKILWQFTKGREIEAAVPTVRFIKPLRFKV